MLGYRTKDFPSLVYRPHKLHGIRQLDEFDAFTDIPVVPFYKQLDRQFPGSKFIYTIRDMDYWLESCRKYPRFRRSIRKLPLKIIKLRQEIYGSVTYDEQKFREAYLRHHEDVLGYFADREEDLLIINLCEGENWVQLCDFLQKEKPDKPFPVRNARVNEYDGYFKR
jgi:hypothetical protein